MFSTGEVKMLGRLDLFDTGDPIQLQIWVHEFDFCETGMRCGEEWAREHLTSCYEDKDLREMFGVPADGNWQVLFKATLKGFKTASLDYGEDYDEELDVEEFQKKPIPVEYMDRVKEPQ